MSYASVASHNIPAGEMPKPDQDLLDGHFAGETATSSDVDHKVNILPAGTDPDHPPVSHEPPSRPEPIILNPPPVEELHTSSVAPEPLKAPHKADVHMPGENSKGLAKKEKEAEKDVKKGLDKAEKKGKEYAKKARAELNEAESRLAPYWDKTKDVVLRPGSLGGLMGVVNVGILGTAGYFAYTRKDQPWDRRIVSAAVVGTLALFGAEGYVADSYLQTPEGKEESERAKREGSKFYLQAKEVVLRPQVAGGLVGAVNVAILGTVGYFTYKHWNQPWDRRIVSAVTVGLLGLSGLEGWAGKVYADKELPKH